MGAGSDTFVISGTEAQSDSFAGGTGTDTIQITGSGTVTLAGFDATASSIEIWLGNGQGVNGTSGNDSFEQVSEVVMTEHDENTIHRRGSSLYAANWHDVPSEPSDVCCWGKNGHDGVVTPFPLMTQS